LFPRDEVLPYKADIGFYKADNATVDVARHFLAVEMRVGFPKVCE